MEKRYFIVFFKYFKGEENGYGSIDYITNGCYINYFKVKKSTEQEIKADNIVFTNIIELSEKDYKDYTKKNDGGTE